MKKKSREICEFEMDFKNFFCWRSDLTNDYIISAQVRLKKGMNF